MADAEKPEGCVSPAGGPIGQPPTTASAPEGRKETIIMTAKVGKPAPDFEANGFFQGGFKNFKLSDYRNKWVLICFYPGDFTFV